MPGERPASLVAHGATTEIESQRSDRFADLRVPCLTILYHPDLSRVGERALLSGLDHGKARALSRLEPRFAHPVRSEFEERGAAAPRPRALEDVRLSRDPLWLRLAPSGAVALDASSTRTPLEIDGQPLVGSVERERADLEIGIQLVLGGQVVVLLHQVDPQGGASRVISGQQLGLVGESEAMLRLRRDIQLSADLDVPVLLLGETGTGKELVARALHRASLRREAPYVTLNIAAVPAQLAAAELFGATRGAFTGAERSRQGHFLRAQGGTLFLDEVGDMPQEVQVLLLRTLESGEIQPVGSDSTREVKVRLIAATDADLETSVDERGFRAPLLHRLAGFVIRLPALRDRPDDFGRLFVHFLRREAAAHGEADRLEPSKHPWVPGLLVARWARLAWPGNVRQLRNAVRQLVIAHREVEVISPDVLPDLLQTVTKGGSQQETRSTTAPAKPSRRPRDIEEEELLGALRKHGFRLQATADELGISRPSLYDRIKKSPSLRTAADLGPDEISRAAEECGDDVRQMAIRLQVSERALQRRLRQLKR